MTDTDQYRERLAEALHADYFKGKHRPHMTDASRRYLLGKVDVILAEQTAIEREKIARARLPDRSE